MLFHDTQTPRRCAFPRKFKPDIHSFQNWPAKVSQQDRKIFIAGGNRDGIVKGNVLRLTQFTPHDRLVQIVDRLPDCLKMSARTSQGGKPRSLDLNDDSRLERPHITGQAGRIGKPPPRFEPKFGEFQNLLDQMMNKNPKKRFPSAQALADYIVNMWPTMLRLMQARSLQHGAKAP